MLQRIGADAEPDSLWMFGTELWLGFETKTECDPDGEISARAVREAGGHLNFAASSTSVKVPDGSFAVIISPQDRVHRPAVAVTAGRAAWCPLVAVAEVADRLTSAWTASGSGPAPSVRRRPRR